MYTDLPWCKATHVVLFSGCTVPRLRCACSIVQTLQYEFTTSWVLMFFCSPRKEPCISLPTIFSLSGEQLASALSTSQLQSCSAQDPWLSFLVDNNFVLRFEIDHRKDWLVKIPPGRLVVKIMAAAKHYKFVARVQYCKCWIAEYQNFFWFPKEKNIQSTAPLWCESLTVEDCLWCEQAIGCSYHILQ